MADKVMEDQNQKSSQLSGPTDSRFRDIGSGKKMGLYGCGLLILGVVIVIVMLVMTGIYVPFEGTEGVGP